MKELFYHTTSLKSARPTKSAEANIDALAMASTKSAKSALFTYDFSHTLQEEVNTSVSIGGAPSLISSCDNSYKGLQVKYGYENYVPTSGSVNFVISRSLATSSISYAFNGSVDWLTNSKSTFTSSLLETRYLVMIKSGVTPLITVAYYNDFGFRDWRADRILEHWIETYSVNSSTLLFNA